MNRAKLYFLISLAVCLPLHLLHKLTLIQPDTGFFRQTGATVILYHLALGLGMAAMAAFGLWRMEDRRLSIANHRMLAVLGGLLGVGMLAVGLTRMLGVYRQIAQGSFLSIAAQIVGGLQLLLSVLGAAVFFRLGTGLWRGEVPNRGSWTFVLPALWALLSSVQMYIEYPQVASLPDRVLYLLCLLSLTLFLVGQGRILSAVDVRRGVAYSCGFGLCAALTGLVLAAGELAALAQGLLTGMGLGQMSLPLSEVLFCLLAGLYCLAFAWNTSPLRPARK